MSWLGRLFGAGVAAPPPPSPVAVVIPADLAEALTAEGEALQPAVEKALRVHLTPPATVAPAPEGAAAARHERVPFWLQRDSSAPDTSDGGSIESRLRDRLEQRRAGESPDPRN